MQRPALAPSLQAVINQGRHAGQRKPITEICIDRMRSALYVACSLKARGFVVIDAELMGHQMPVVKVDPDWRTAEMIEHLHAGYIADGRDQMGAYRIGQFELDGVAVQWEERGGV